jgi:glutamyl-tRNA reductase
MFEHGAALQKIAQGKNVEQVLDQMARRIMDKLMHPVYREIANTKTDYDAEVAKQAYMDQYLNKIPRASDHIDDTLT